MEQGVQGGTRRWLPVAAAWLAALLVALAYLWDNENWASPGLLGLMTALCLVLDALARHYDDSWGARFSAGSIVAICVAAIVLGPVPAAIIGGATAWLDSALLHARRAYVWGNSLNSATIGLIGGLLAEQWVREMDGIAYAVGALALFVVMEFIGVVLWVAYDFVVPGDVVVGVFARYARSTLPWLFLAGLVVAGVVYGYRAGGLGVLCLFSAALVLCQLLLLRLDRVQGQLRSERDLHRSYLQMVATAVVSLDGNLRVTFANRRAVELLQVREPVGLDWGALIGDHQRGRYAALLAGHSDEERFDSRVGSRVVEWHATVVADDGGGVASLLLAGEDVTQRRAEEERMEFLAYNDTLTGLPNGARFDAELAEALNGDRPAALLLVDLDDFKRVNDTHGHEAGDRVLAETAARLRAVKGRDDLLARGESDEFLIWVADLGVELEDGAGARRAAASIAEALARTFDAPFPVTGTAPGIAVSASVSMALFPHDAMQPAELRRVADAAMNGIKQRAASRGY
jgi:diguanylate cyclase (GGDEF)-like protein